MSVAAVVTLRAGVRAPAGFPAAGYLPVTTESDFYRYWRPIATRCDLDVVVAMGHGVSLGPDDLVLADEQLGRIAAEASARLPAAVATRIVERTRLLRDLLALLTPDMVEEVYLG